MGCRFRTFVQKQMCMKSNWFKHPLGLSNDKRLAQLLQEEGVKGYGTYLYLIEILSQQEDCSLSFHQLPLFERKGFHRRYMELIVRKYPELFIVEGDDFCSAIDFGSSCTRSAQRLRTSYVEPKQNTPKSDNRLNNSNVNTSSRTHVREEKNREEKNHLQKDVVAAKRELVENERFGELLHGLTLQSSWGELACMKSGYSTLLDRHFDEAVRLFGEHVVLYGNQHQMHNVSDVQRYFVNFVASGSRTSKELYAKLQALERERQQDAENLYRYEQCIDGRRCYMGCPLPDDAPPRPSPKAIWNEHEAYWYEPTG